MLKNAIDEVIRKHRAEFYDQVVKIEEFIKPLLDDQIKQVEKENPDLDPYLVRANAKRILQEKCYQETGYRPLCRDIAVSECGIMKLEEFGDQEIVIDEHFLGWVGTPARNSHILEIWHKIKDNPI